MQGPSTALTKVLQFERILFIHNGFLRDMTDKLMLINIWKLFGNGIEGFKLILIEFHARLGTTKRCI